MDEELAGLSAMQRKTLENWARRAAKRKDLKLWQWHQRYMVTDGQDRPIAGTTPHIYSLTLPGAVQVIEDYAPKHRRVG